MEMNQVPRSFRRPDRRAREAGFSLVEVLIAGAILLIIALGIIPLFSRSLVNNRQGADATLASQFGLSRVEELYQVDFNHASLNPTPPDTPVQEFYTRTDKVWEVGAPEPDSIWTRATTVEEFTVGDLYDNKILDGSTPVDPADPTTIHLKRIGVGVATVRAEGNPLGRRRDLDLSSARPF
jgi:type II secretory pathway pseudopilin PulG